MYSRSMKLPNAFNQIIYKTRAIYCSNNITITYYIKDTELEIFIYPINSSNFRYYDSII